VRHESIASSVKLISCSRPGSRAKLLPQQLQHVVGELVPWSTHSAQMHRQEVRVGRDVGGRAVQLVQSEPEGIRIHLDQVLENTVGRNRRCKGRGLLSYIYIYSHTSKYKYIYKYKCIFNSIQFICIAQFHKLQICLGVLYNLYT